MTRLKLGLLGGGQLAALTAQAALNRDLELIGFCNTIHDPLVSFCDKIFLGSNLDQDVLKNFFNYCDKVLLESEFFDYDLLIQLEEDSHSKIYPELSDYKNLYTKRNQKEFMQKIGVPLAPTFNLQANDIPFPCIVKKSHGGYDGYGNWEIASQSELDDFKRNKIDNEYFIEEKLQIITEYAALLVKGRNHDFIFDICETVQVEHQCLYVHQGPEISEEDNIKIKEITKKISQHLSGPGIYAFEFFKTNKGIVFNEAAPRVHNSFHFSIEAYSHSQFEMFLSAVLDETLDIPELKYKRATMLNIVGREQGDYHLSFPYQSEMSPYKIHMYGKSESRPGRKLGHITFFGDERVRQSAEAVQGSYNL